ncbi:MAG: integral rane protein [Frankiales bacterium]|nr:integral rane protein [Frankiales bacterium]
MLAGVLVGAALLVLLGVRAPTRPVLREAVGPPQSGTSLPRVWVVAVPAVAALVVGPLAAGLGLLGTAAFLRTWRRRAAAALRQQEREGAAEALSALSSELRAGRPTTQALEAAAAVATGPLARALQAAAAAAVLGADPVDALLRRAPDSAVPELLRGLAACWQVCAGTGSSLAAAVERLAESVRAQQEQRYAVDSELAGPRATAAMLALLPLAGIALAAGLGARPLHVLLHTAVGVACVTAGLGLELLGLWWTSRLVAAAGGTR